MPADVVTFARSVQAPIRERARAIEQERRFPADLARTMAEAGLFRMALPKTLGGSEVEAGTLCEAIELLGEADASVGWCVMIGATSAVVGAYLDPQAAEEIFAEPTTIVGGVFAPMGRAILDGDRYRVSGRWQWASGSANCRWLMGGSTILDDGAPRRLPNGTIENRLMIFPASEATLLDSWFAAGLCGTGSGEMEVQDVVVPASRSVSLFSDPPRERGPLYAFPVFGLLALGIAAVMLGNARGAIADLVELAGGKRPQGASRTVAERATAQATLADAEARLRGARAFFYEAIDEAWRRAARGDAIPIRERAALRLAATHAARASADVARTAYDLGGGSSVHLSSPLQRRFRDAHAGTQHLMVSPPTMELVGRVLMGLPTDPTQL